MVSDPIVRYELIDHEHGVEGRWTEWTAKNIRSSSHKFERDIPVGMVLDVLTQSYDREKQPDAREENGEQ